MKIKLAAMILLINLYAVDLLALTVTVDFGDATLNTYLAPLVVSQLETELGGFDNMPKLTKGFGDASTYASHAATMRGYQGYDFFAFAVGSMFSMQSPGSNPASMMDMVGDFQEEGVFEDQHAGLGSNPLVFHGGVNLGFLLDGLYMSVKYGKLNLKTGHEYSLWRFNYTASLADIKVEYDTTLAAILFNYQIVSAKSIMARTLMWRGLTVESGVIYTSNTISLYKKIDVISVNATVAPFTFEADVDPSVDLVMSTKSIIVPIELYGSIRFLYFLNLGVGGGMDYVPYSKTSFALKSAGSIVVTDDGATNASGLVGTTGSVSIEAGTKDVKSSKYRPKGMLNIGLSIGPVFVDLPITYYFTDNGYAAGISAGMSF